MQRNCEWQECLNDVRYIFQYDRGERVMSLCRSHAFALMRVYPDGLVINLELLGRWKEMATA